MASGKTPAAHLFELASQGVSPRWGMARGFSDPYTPSLSLDFFVAKAGPVSVSVLDQQGIEVNQITLEADAGFNSVPFHMNFSKAGKSTFLKKNKMKLTTATDGNTYLPKGTYKVEITSGKAQSSQTLKLE
jgi:hypothetical protein